MTWFGDPDMASMPILTPALLWSLRLEIDKAPTKWLWAAWLLLWIRALWQDKRPLTEGLWNLSPSLTWGHYTWLKTCPQYSQINLSSWKEWLVEFIAPIMIYVSWQHILLLEVQCTNDGPSSVLETKHHWCRSSSIKWLTANLSNMNMLRMCGLDVKVHNKYTSSMCMACYAHVHAQTIAHSHTHLWVRAHHGQTCAYGECKCAMHGAVVACAWRKNVWDWFP